MPIADQVAFFAALKQGRERSNAYLMAQGKMEQEPVDREATMLTAILATLKFVEKNAAVIRALVAPPTDGRQLDLEDAIEARR